VFPDYNFFHDKKWLNRTNTPYFAPLANFAVQFFALAEG